MVTSTEMPSFFKIHPGDQFSNKLKIPREFLQHFHGDIPNKCHLETAAQSWLVEAEKVNNKFFFQKGWNKFVVDNDLKYGEFLVFNYAGNSNFHVDIFGINGCLKLTELPDEMEEVDEDDDVSLEVLDDSPLSTPLPQTRIKTSGRGKAEINSNLRERGPNPEKTEMKKREAHWSNCELKWKADFPANKDRAGTSSTLVSGVKKHEHVEALQRAKAFKDENPSSVLVSMTHSYIKYWFVRLPSEFTRLVRPSIGDSGNVLLRVSAGRVRTWPARVTCESSGSNRTKIHCGWTNFVQANKLKQGDVCAFVLIKDIKVVIEVVIFRNKDAENCRFSPDISDNHYEEDVDFEDDAEDEDEDDEEEEEEDDNFLPRSRTLGVASSFHKRKINRTSSSAKGHSRNMKQAGRLFKDYMILKAIAKEEADAFKETCDHPSFVVSLPASCARGSKWNNGFDFPRSFAIQYLTKQQPRRVTLWIKKRFWLVKVNYYGKTARLQGGWGQFVKDNNLTTGDACVFVLTNPSIFDFDVENFRLSK